MNKKKTLSEFFLRLYLFFLSASSVVFPSSPSGPTEKKHFLRFSSSHETSAPLSASKMCSPLFPVFSIEVGGRARERVVSFSVLFRLSLNNNKKHQNNNFLLHGSLGRRARSFLGFGREPFLSSACARGSSGGGRCPRASSQRRRRRRRLRFRLFNGRSRRRRRLSLLALLSGGRRTRRGRSGMPAAALLLLGSRRGREGPRRGASDQLFSSFFFNNQVRERKTSSGSPRRRNEKETEPHLEPRDLGGDLLSRGLGGGPAFRFRYSAVAVEFSLLLLPPSTPFSPFSPNRSLLLPLVAAEHHRTEAHDEDEGPH